MRSQRTTAHQNETLNKLENAIFSKNMSKAKATYTQCLPQHTRVLHMRVLLMCIVLVFVCAFFGLDPKLRQRPRSFQRRKETTTGQQA